jgi:hypothetical protein
LSQLFLPLFARRPHPLRLEQDVNSAHIVDQHGAVGQKSRPVLRRVDMPPRSSSVRAHVPAPLDGPPVHAEARAAFYRLDSPQQLSPFVGCLGAGEGAVPCRPSSAGRPIPASVSAAHTGVHLASSVHGRLMRAGPASSPSSSRALQATGARLDRNSIAEWRARPSTAHIFERFHRAQTVGHRSALGIGLYVSRSIVNLPGGRIAAVLPWAGRAYVVLPVPTDMVHASS